MNNFNKKEITKGTGETKMNMTQKIKNMKKDFRGIGYKIQGIESTGAVSKFWLELKKGQKIDLEKIESIMDAWKANFKKNLFNEKTWEHSDFEMEIQSEFGHTLFFAFYKKGPKSELYKDGIDDLAIDEMF